MATGLRLTHSAVAIAYTMHKAPYVFPIIGGRKIEHLQSNIEALGIRLSDEQIAHIEGVLPFDKGFPNNLIVSGFVTATLLAERLTVFIGRVWPIPLPAHVVRHI